MNVIEQNYKTRNPSSASPISSIVSGAVTSQLLASKNRPHSQQQQPQQQQQHHHHQQQQQQFMNTNNSKTAMPASRNSFDQEQMRNSISQGQLNSKNPQSQQQAHLVSKSNQDPATLGGHQNFSNKQVSMPNLQKPPQLQPQLQLQNHQQRNFEQMKQRIPDQVNIES
jgi:hypothetical protein